jgi:ketosteroid isomerase-like protein
MSANLDLVRSIYADWERGDFSRDGWAVSEIQYVRVGWGPEDGTSIGPDGMASVFRSWLSAWRDWKLLAESYLEVDGERVLVSYSFTGRGKASGMELGQLRTVGAHLFNIRAGKVARLTVYADPDRALADLGLMPDGPYPEV